MNLLDKIKHKILANFNDYDNWLFIGKFIERRIELAGLSGDIDIVNDLCKVSCFPKLTVSRSIDTFKVDFQAMITALFNEVIDKAEFMTDATETITNELTSAWMEGAAECGVLALSVSEQDRLTEFIDGQLQYLNDLALSIQQAQGGLVQPLLNRSEMWISRYNEAYVIGAAMACADELREWQLGDTEEHCLSCQTLNGLVYRYSTWLEWEAYPKSSKLLCKGFRCDCRLVATDKLMSTEEFPAWLFT